jgi:hypothetical protein
MVGRLLETPLSHFLNNFAQISCHALPCEVYTALFQSDPNGRFITLHSPGRSPTTLISGIIFAGRGPPTPLVPSRRPSTRSPRITYPLYRVTDRIVTEPCSEIASVWDQDSYRIRRNITSNARRLARAIMQIVAGGFAWEVCEMRAVRASLCVWSACQSASGTRSSIWQSSTRALMNFRN